MKYKLVAAFAVFSLCASPIVYAQENDWLEQAFPKSGKGKYQQQTHVDDGGIGCDIVGGAVGMIPYLGPFIAPAAARGCEAERVRMLEQHRRQPRQSTRVYATGIPKDRAIAVARSEIKKALEGELGERLLVQALESGKLDNMLRLKFAEFMVNAAKAKGVPSKSASPQVEAAPPKLPEADTTQGVGAENRRPSADIQAKFVLAVLRDEDEPNLLKLAAPPPLPHVEKDMPSKRASPTHRPKSWRTLSEYELLTLERQRGIQ